jgi:laminin beta 1
MTVRGSCSCYGHAERCLPERPEHNDILGMVHGTCDCNHNTYGGNCEYCNDMYNDLPWRPATGKKKNECKSKLFFL